MVRLKRVNIIFKVMVVVYFLYSLNCIGQSLDALKLTFEKKVDYEKVIIKKSKIKSIQKWYYDDSRIHDTSKHYPKSIGDEKILSSIPYMMNERQFNKKGKIIDYTDYNYDGVISLRQLYFYDKYGNLTLKTYYSLFFGLFDTLFFAIPKFNSNNKLVEAECFEKKVDKNSLKIRYNIFINYYSNGKVSKIKYNLEKDSIVYYYDSKGKLLSKYPKVNGYILEYDSLNQLYQSKFILDSGQFKLYSYKFDDKNNLIDFNLFEQKKDSMYHIEHYENKYDINGNLHDSMNPCQYDSVTGNLLKRIVCEPFDTLNSSFMFYLWEYNYVYDSKNSLQFVYKNSYSNGNYLHKHDLWKPQKSAISYKYAPSGQLIEEKYKGGFNKDQLLHFEAPNHNYVYDEKGKLIEETIESVMWFEDIAKYKYFYKYY